MERQSPSLRNRLWQLIDEAKGDDVLAPVTVVGPTRYANLSLRHELGRRGFANVRFIVLPVLSEMLGAATLAQAGRRPLAAALEGVAIRAALSDATGQLASVSFHSATQASARSSFRELRKAPDAVIDALEQQVGVRSEVVRLFRRFRQETAHDWYDSEDLAEAATEAVLGGQSSALDELGLIVFFLPGDVTPGETRLIEALAKSRPLRGLAGYHGRRRRRRPVSGPPQRSRAGFARPWVIRSGRSFVSCSSRRGFPARRPQRPRGAALGHPADCRRGDGEEDTFPPDGDSVPCGKPVCLAHSR